MISQLNKIGESSEKTTHKLLLINA